MEIAPRLYDFGECTAGYVRLRVRGEKGTRIKLNYAERLTPDGQHVDRAAFTKWNYPDMYNSDEYILDGTERVLEQQMAFHGFRYAEILGECEILEVCAVTAHTDLPSVATFSCDVPVLTAIHESACQSILTCTQDLMLDNPKRDASWLGDIMLSTEAVLTEFDASGMFADLMAFCADVQRENGAIPYDVSRYYYDWTYVKLIGPDWGDSVVFHVPYYMYRYTGDRTLVDQMWDVMNRSLEFFRTLGDGGYLLNRLGTGDWSAVKATEQKCALEPVMTAYYYWDVQMMAEMAAATDRDPAPYESLADHIRAAYREKYVRNGRVDSEQITELILPAFVGLLTPHEAADTAARVSQKLTECGNTITFGAHGIRMGFELLARHGYAEQVVRTLMNDRAPGFASCIRDGLHTLPERFDYGIAGIFSLNHHFFSPVDTWLYRWIAGIQFDGLKKRTVTVAPQPVPQVHRFDVSLRGVRVQLDDGVLTVTSPQPFRVIWHGETRDCQAGTFQF